MGPVDQQERWSPWPAPIAAFGAPAGWYDDPHRRSELRWWDGGTWTDHEHGAAAGPVPLRAALAGVAVLVVVRVMVELALGSLRDDVVPVWLVAVGFYIVVFGSMVVTARRGLDPAGQSWRWLRRQLRVVDIGWGVVVWLSVMAAAVAAVSLIHGVGLPFRSNGDVVRDYRDRYLPLFVVTSIAAVIVAPIVEEVFFRGLLLRGLLSRVPAWAAVVLQGLLFGLYHVIPGYGRANLGLVLVLSAYGVVFGGWVRHTGRLGPTIVGHAITNSVVVLIALAR